MRLERAGGAAGGVLTSSSLIYRNGGIDDLAAVYELNRQSFPESWSREGLASAINGGFELHLCLDGEHLAGYLLSNDILDEVHIMQIAVAPGYRRQGIAEALSRNLIAARPGMKVMLEVRSSNLAAQALYKKLGFVRSGLRKGYYVTRDGEAGREDAVLMHCRGD